MTVRYLCNTTEWNCGVVALVNALKFQGKQVTAKQANAISRRIRRAEDGGLTIKESTKLYRKHGITRIYKCDFGKVAALLTTGHAVISIINCTQTKKLADGTIRITVAGHAFTITGIKFCGPRVWFYCTNMGGHRWLTLQEIVDKYKAGTGGNKHERVWFSTGYKVKGKARVWN